MEKIKLLFVEDSKDLVFMISNSLDITGRYDICTAYNGKDGFDLYKSFAPDIIVSDIDMPIMDGKEMVRLIKEIDTNTPIIFLTAFSTPKDFIEGLEVGAVGYLTKPLIAEVLDAQICSLLKWGSQNLSPVAGTDECTIGTLVFSLSGKYLSRNGKLTDLTKIETKILNLLVKNKGLLVKREDFLNEIGSKSYFFSSQALNVHILSLRKKLEKNSTIKIITVRGEGYILQEGFKKYSQ